MPKTRAFEISPLPLEAQFALEALGSRIARARKERDYSQRVFAQMMGVSLTTLVSLEKGAPTVQIGHYARAAWLLELTWLQGSAENG